MKPKLLVLELWRVGDLAISAPFLQAASQHFEVTLLAQPVAQSLQPRFFPSVKVVPFVAPWTAFRHKYRLWDWPWTEILNVCHQLRAEKFDFAVSARWDTREHLLMRFFGARKRLGFPRLGSQIFLTQLLKRLSPLAHRYDDWWVAARAIGLKMRSRKELPLPPARTERVVMVHTGAALAVRVWPLERYLNIVRRLRNLGFSVRVACDAGQRGWWLQHGEEDVSSPQSIEELLSLLDRCGACMGNDSGPGHLAALMGIPTFTIFGPQFPEWFAPLHPASQWMDGKPCPYKQCFDYCRFPVPHCLWNITEEEVWPKLEVFIRRHRSA
ncbi:MAG: glycosyltransferase family 9 protein [Verrucomicrobiota bacterium]